MSKLENVSCYYTGGGVYCATAKYGDVYISTDFEMVGVYDVPVEDIENEDKYKFDYDGHSVDPKTCELPTWREFLTAIRNDGGEYYSDSFYPEIESTVLKSFKSLDVRIGECPGPDVQLPYPSEERLELIAPIIEIFEDFLDDKGIVIENDEKAESEGPANIYGTDWGNLCDRIEYYLIKIGVLKGEA